MLVHADDFSAAGKLDDLKKWCDTLTIIGLKLVTTQNQKKHGLRLSNEQLRYFLKPR